MRINVAPIPEFYGLFTNGQIEDLALNLREFLEIPRKYCYFGDGVSLWDQNHKRLIRSTSISLATATDQLIELNAGYLSALAEVTRPVNVIDLGAGNGRPAEAVLHLLSERKLVNRYLAVDISSDMLSVAIDNIEALFSGRFSIEALQLDLGMSSYREKLLSNGSGWIEEGSSIVLHLGSTLFNLRSPDIALGLIRDSMRATDYFVQVQRIYSDIERVDLARDPQQPAPFGADLSPLARNMLGLLGLSKETYEGEIKYCPEKHQWFERARLKRDIRFMLGDADPINIDAGDSLVVLRVMIFNQSELIEMLGHAGFHTLHVSQTIDRRFALTISTLCDQRIGRRSTQP